MFRDWAQYRHCIDLPGRGYSGRVPALFLLGCTVWIAERAASKQQYWWGLLEAGVHYVPIKADGSDMAEKIRWARSVVLGMMDPVGQVSALCSVGILFRAQLGPGLIKDAGCKGERGGDWTLGGGFLLSLVARCLSVAVALRCSYHCLRGA